MGIEADRPLTAQPADRGLPRGPLFWAAVVVGWSVIGFGVAGVFADARFTHPRSLAIWIVGCLIAHDFVLAPLVFTAGKVLRHAGSGLTRGLLQSCLVLYGLFVLVSIPVLGRFGQRPDNPTLLPRNYAVGLIVALVIVWLCTTSVFLVVGWRRRP